MERDCNAWINILSHKVKRRLDSALSGMGINAFQCRVLHYIRVHYRDGPVFQRDVEGVFSLSRSTATGVLQHLIEGGDLTLYGLANAVTRYSQDVENYDRASKLEEIGYQVMTMSPKLFQAINQMQPVTLAA